MNGKEQFYFEEFPVPMERKGFVEETYWTFSYSPMPNDDGSVGGLLCSCVEMTETVLGKRRMKIIKDIAHTPVLSHTVAQACQAACNVLTASADDVPFGIFYLIDQQETEATLSGQTGSLPEALTPLIIDIALPGKDGPWPLAKVLREKQPETVNLSDYSTGLPSDNVGSKMPGRAVILPVGKQGENGLFGFFILGLSQKLEYDADYQNFHQMLAGQIATALTTVHAQAEAERQRARLERFFMQAPAAICVLDGTDMAFEMINPLYQQLFPGRELLGKPALVALPEIADQPIWAIIQNVYRTGETFEGNELLIPLARHEGGPIEDIYFNFIYQARYDAQGKIDGILVFANEVTDRVLARQQVEQSERALQTLSQELAASNEELQSANEEILANNEELGAANGQLTRINIDLDNFIYTASHDLKAPISNIEGLLQALLRQLPEESLALERVQRITGMIQDSIERFKRTIAHLTEVTKLQKDNSHAATQMDLSQVVQEVVLDLEPLALAAGAKLDIQVGAYPFRFSPKNLRSIVYNLLSNALKYRSPERVPLVQLRCKQTDEYLIFSVQDNGLGMNLSKDQKLFSMFKRLHDHVEGSGIGLYMVKKIVENAGGKIEVESKPGEGSTFRVYFRR